MAALPMVELVELVEVAEDVRKHLDYSASRWDQFVLEK